MRLILQPNSWSCTIAAAAMVLDTSIKNLVEMIGHDGSEIMFPELPEPGKRRGFHIQEIVDCVFKFRYSVTPIEILPYSTPNNNKDDFPINFPGGNKERLLRYLSNSKGLLTGISKKWGHTVAWTGKHILDPNGDIYPFSDCKININCYWLFTKIKSI